jgi:nucleotide-binding universal stress UspA family protein
VGDHLQPPNPTARRPVEAAILELTRGAHQEDTMATVIATDGSDLAKKALDAGLQLAKATGDEVVIVTAWQIPVGDFGIPYASIATTELIDAERTGAERTLREAAEAARAVGVEAITELREGSAAHEICEVAKERRARMVVLGSHGWGALRSALYGSVAAGVLRHAPCPVLLVPDRKPD